MNSPLRVVLLLLLALAAAQGNAQIAHVEVIQNESGFQLLRDGEPYFIKGAGAKEHFDLLKSSGANSIRIWSTGRVDLLDSAAQHGMTVALGLYVRPERTGMDYNDTYAVRGQIEQLKTEILKYKDHPALLLWGIGNEMDLRYSNFKVWDTVEELAQFIKEVDPHHPTMTVIAGLDPSKAHMIKSRCPSVDILGINAYGSIENTPANIRKFNWDKPYIFSEWGVNGPFEAPRTAWGAKIEPPNGIKVNMRQRRYVDRILADSERCLGSYCFLWGQKQESTATWHGMFTADGHPTEAVDVMQQCWTGSWPAKRAPSILDIQLNGAGWRKDHVMHSGEEGILHVDIESPPDDALTIEYRLYRESQSRAIGGDLQEEPEELSIEVSVVDDATVRFRAPQEEGAYRIFAFVRNERNQYSVANVPFLIH